MKRMLVAILGPFLVSVLSVGHSVGGAEPTPLVVTFLLRPIPVSFLKTATATEIDGQTVLNYAINEEEGRNFSRLQLIAFTVAPSGEVKGGQGWTIDVDDTENAFAQKSITLVNKPKFRDRVLLTVLSAEGRSGRLAVSSAQIRDYLGAYRSRTTGRDVRATVRLAHTAAHMLDAGGPCDVAVCVARRTCGCGGIESFSCNPQTGQYSFSCYPRNGCQDAPLPEDCGQ